MNEKKPLQRFEQDRLQGLSFRRKFEIVKLLSVILPRDEIGSCAHCAKLRNNVVAAMKQANIPETELETISDLVKITRMGIITTPALIVDGKLLCCGKVLSVEELLPLLKQNSEPKAE